MGLNEDFDDRKLQTEAESEQYHPYEYQTEGNTSWAGALPVKQCVHHILAAYVQIADLSALGDCMTPTLKKMRVV
jgi:hypothetical protein